LSVPKGGSPDGSVLTCAFFTRTNDAVDVVLNLFLRSDERRREARKG
jgi:hypothetical protein